MNDKVILGNLETLKHIHSVRANLYKCIQELDKRAREHHYSKNRHHPEFHKEGIDGMDLFDLIEMLVDWKAATERNKNGNIRKSIDINTERFKISPQLKKILENTVNRNF
jgi:hypothetical protein